MFPIFALVISKKVEIKRYQNIFRIWVGVFLLHNLLFFIGFSLYGDYIDYLIFAVEYFAFCLLIFSISTDKLYAKVLRILGIIGISFGGLIGLVGILLFIVVSQDYESDKKIQFENYGDRYEVRRYSFGFATLDDIRYTFETYRRYKYFPVEYKIDKTDFFDSKTRVNISEDSLAIYIAKNGTEKDLVFKSSDGNFFLKKLN
jgi:hypothetical protein